MKKFFLVLLLLLALLYIFKPRKVKGNMIVVLVDNHPNILCESAWGLSIYIEIHGKRILFDTGPDPFTLTRNARRMGIDLNKIDFVVISHDHLDHTGGLEAIKGKIVFVPPESKINGIKVYNTTEIAKNIYVIPFGFEQALAINYSNKLILITGCAHPGVLKMAKKAVEELKLEPYLIIGGFHLGENEKRAREVIEGLISLGFKKIAPIHCSGETIRRILREEYKEYYLDARVCSVIPLQ